MKAVKLKLGTHLDSGLVYYVYQSRDQRPITSLDRFYNLMKHFCRTFLKNYKGNKVETWYTYGQWIDISCIPESGPRAYTSWI